MIAYAIFFVGLHIAETLVVKPDERDPLWETLTDLTMLTLGFVGMALFFNRVDDPNVQMVWKLIAPLLVIGQLFMFIRYLKGRPELMAEDDALSSKETLGLEIGILVLLSPSLGINLLFAFK